jgi:tRNA(Ile)-lysidine synthase TilS/MesJ
MVGASAGVDSMVRRQLRTACREVFDLSLIVAHVNPGFRPEGSEREVELVQKESVRLHQGSRSVYLS